MEPTPRLGQHEPLPSPASPTPTRYTTGPQRRSPLPHVPHPLPRASLEELCAPERSWVYQAIDDPLKELLSRFEPSYQLAHSPNNVGHAQEFLCKVFQLTDAKDLFATAQAARTTLDAATKGSTAFHPDINKRLQALQQAISRCETFCTPSSVLSRSLPQWVRPLIVQYQQLQGAQLSIPQWLSALLQTPLEGKTAAEIREMVEQYPPLLRPNAIGLDAAAVSLVKAIRTDIDSCITALEQPEIAQRRAHEDAEFQKKIAAAYEKGDLALVRQLQGLPPPPSLRDRMIGWGKTVAGTATEAARALPGTAVAVAKGIGSGLATLSAAATDKARELAPIVKGAAAKGAKQARVLGVKGAKKAGKLANKAMRDASNTISKALKSLTPPET